MPVLEIGNLTKRFGGLTAVDDMSFSVEKGEVVGLLGPNGSGKTTLLNLVSGALPPSAGSIKLQGREIAKLPAHKISRLGIARTFQLVRSLPSLTASENIIASLAFRANNLWGPKAVIESHRILELVGLAGRGAEPVTEFNYIDQKRLELARALASEPEVLLLDEWLSGLNPTELQTGIALIKTLEQQNISIIIVEHIMAAVRALCPRCVVMNAGQLIADNETSLALDDPLVVSAYLGSTDTDSDANSEGEIDA